MFLILASLPSQLVEFRRISKLLRDRGEAVRLLVENEGLLSEPGSELLTAPLKWTRRDKATAKLFGAFFVTVRASLVQARKELSSSRPKGLIVGEDGVGGNLAWIAAAKEAGIPVVIVPYEYSGAEQAIAAIRPQLDDFAVSGFWGRVFAKWRPAWVKKVDRRDILRLPLRYAWGYELAGIAPANPWTVHGGRADKLLAESPQMVAHYRKEGVPSQKVVHAGSLAFDDLHEALKAAKPPQGNLRILCALPPDYTADRGPMPYPDLVKAWIGEAQKHGDVAVQAHPAARESLRKIGVEFDTRDITTLIAENDLLVTSVSSIIRYALAAGRPVLNFDCYRFDYPDYLSATGCRTVSSFDDFARSLADVVADFEGYRKTAMADASIWGNIDGNAGKRIAATLSHLPTSPN